LLSNTTGQDALTDSTVRLRHANSKSTVAGSIDIKAHRLREATGVGFLRASRR
jgi:hypothetical protein